MDAKLGQIRLGSGADDAVAITSKRRLRVLKRSLGFWATRLGVAQEAHYGFGNQPR